MLNVEKEIKIIPLIGPLIYISGPNVKHMIPMFRLRVGTLKAMDYQYSSMYFVRQILGPFYYMKSCYSCRVLKEQSDPTHPNTTYPAAVAAKKAREEG